MSIAAAENAGLGQCELQLPDPWITHAQLSQGSPHLSQPSPASSISSQPLLSPPPNPLGGLLQQQQLQQQQSTLQNQNKIMNAVAPAVACPPAATKKLRRKTENKPQSQINKCNNEKRRRELENEYIEQLGEFLQINKQDVTSCKPDKAAVLNAVVRKFKSILGLQPGSRDIGSRCTKCPPDCADSCTVHPIQQGEVSSTEPPLPESSVNGHSPEKWAYFEAVNHFISSAGWVLLEINSDGYIECVTENIKDLVRYTRNELHSKSIYSYLHPGDHNKFHPILNKMSFSLNWDDEDNRQTARKRQQKFRIRLLVKAPEGASETMEQKQQRQAKYEEAVLIAAPVNENNDGTSSLLCLLTRPEDDTFDVAVPPQKLEQLTLKIDRTGQILNLDVTALRPQYASFTAKETNGRSIQDLCHRSDLQIVQSHVKDVLQSGSDTVHSLPFRLRLGGPDVYVHVKAQSRLFVSANEDFIMIVNTVLGDAGIAELEGQMNNTNLSLPSSSHHNAMTSMGGPLMTSVMNGSLQQPPSTNNRPNHAAPYTSTPPSSDSSNYFQGDPFDFEFPNTTFEMDAVNVVWDTRPDSRTSVTPGSTPRPPSVSYSPVCRSPLTPYHNSTNNQGQQSPQNNNNNNNNNSNNNLNNNTAFNNSNFPFPNFDDKTDNKIQEPLPNQPQEQHQQQQQQQLNHDSERLRILLTTKRPSASETETEQDQKNRILKGLLKSEEDKDGQHNKMSVGSGSSGSGGGRIPSGARSRPSMDNNKNNMLLQLLNDKSDDDDPELRGNRSQSELLRQLQKSNMSFGKDANTNQMDNAELIQMLRAQPVPNDLNSRIRKRSANESDDGCAAKRSDDKQPSRLREKNKMLARLLEHPSKAPSTVLPPTLDIKIIPDIPNSFNTARVTSTTAQQQQQQQQHQQQQRQHAMSLQQQQQQQPPQLNNNSITNNNNQKQVQQQMLNTGRMTAAAVRKQQQQQQQQQAAQNTPSDVYLNQQTNNQTATQQPNSDGPGGHSNMMQPPSSRSHNVFQQQQQMQQDSGSFATSTAATTTPSTASLSTSSQQQLQLQPELDYELSEIIDDFIDIVPEGNYQDTELNYLGPMDGSKVNSVPVQTHQPDYNEKMAINMIQQNLMAFEQQTPTFNSSPPAYSVHGGSVMVSSQQQPQPNQQGFPPPPIYSNRSVRLPQMGNNVNIANANITNAMRLQQYQQRLQQKQQRDRLLQQQQNQQMVVPVNATAGADQMCLNPNIDSLLNNSVAPPNVSLQRNNTVIPDSQLSPGFPQSLMQQQLSPNTRPPFSPQQQNYPQSPFNTNTGQRLSPQQQQPLTPQQIVSLQQQQSQQQNNNPQLSPRQPPQFTQGPQPNQPQPQPQQQQQQQQQQWNANANARMTLQQQQNPMLNAQLTQSVFNARQFTQRQRSLNSPGAQQVSRQNSFTGSETGFPGPPSPTQAGYGTSGVFNNQQMRMQRQTSVPQATQHLPGSPRPYGQEATGYGMMYSSMQHPTGTPGDFYGRTQTGGTTNLNSSEYVRQELRNVVSGRTQQGGGIRTPQSPLGMGQGPMVGNANNSNNGGLNIGGAQQQQHQQQMSGIPGTLNTPTDPSSMGFNFDIAQSDFFGGNTAR